MKKIQHMQLFPCPLCGGDNHGQINALCDNCLKQFPFFQGGEKCPGCGKVFDHVLALCNSCLAEEKRPWHKALALGDFSGINRQMVLALKFGGKLHLARTLGGMAAKLQAEEGDKVDCIVPVPLHFIRMLTRGFNQSALLAETVGKALNVPVINALKRIRRTKHQASLDREQRMNNIKDCFVLRKNVDLTGKKILLLDDVMTTGMTLTAAANALKIENPLRINVLVIARGH